MGRRQIGLANTPGLGIIPDATMPKRWALVASRIVSVSDKPETSPWVYQILHLIVNGEL